MEQYSHGRYSRRVHCVLAVHSGYVGLDEVERGESGHLWDEETEEELEDRRARRRGRGEAE